MIPEAARIIGFVMSVDGGDLLYGRHAPDLKFRYNTWYIEALVKGCIYIIPACQMAWYCHTGEWPSMAVRQRNGVNFDFAKENLFLHGKHEAPKVRMVKRLTADEARTYSGVRARSYEGGAAASSG